MKGKWRNEWEDGVRSNFWRWCPWVNVWRWSLAVVVMGKSILRYFSPVEKCWLASAGFEEIQVKRESYELISGWNQQEPVVELSFSFLFGLILRQNESLTHIFTSSAILHQFCVLSLPFGRECVFHYLLFFWFFEINHLKNELPFQPEQPSPAKSSLTHTDVFEKIGFLFLDILY